MSDERRGHHRDDDAEHMEDNMNQSDLNSNDERAIQKAQIKKKRRRRDSHHHHHHHSSHQQQHQAQELTPRHAGGRSRNRNMYERDEQEEEYSYGTESFEKDEKHGDSFEHEDNEECEETMPLNNAARHFKHNHGGSIKRSPRRRSERKPTSGPFSVEAMAKQASSTSLAGQNTSGYEIDTKNNGVDIWVFILVFLSYVFLVFSFPFSMCACVKIAQEYERAVIFRIGRILPGGTKGPGIFFILPCIDTYIKVDLRTVTFDVPPQEILTRDSVTVSVDAVVYFRIFNATISVINVEDAAKSTKLLAASTLRNILGTKSLHEILSDRESVAVSIQATLDDATGPWGVKVERVEVKDVRLPVQLQRAMATEAEAAREARAKVIAAEGEQNASTALKKAAQVISESPIAIQLRYLQTLTQIASEKNSTIVFPIPLEMLSFLSNKSANAFNRNTNINVNDKSSGATTAKIANEVQEQTIIKPMVEKF